MSMTKWRVDIELVYSPLRTKTIIVESKTRRKAEKIALQRAAELYVAPIYEVVSSENITKQIKAERKIFNEGLRWIHY